MIQVIIHIFTTIINGFHFLFWTSYSIGKLISWIFCSAVNVLFFIWGNVREAGTIFSEDFLIFLKDFVEIIANVLDVGKESIVTSCMFLYSVVNGTIATVIELITTGNIHTANVGQQCVNSFGAMMNALKNLFVLIGNGSWFVLTLLPKVLIALFAYIHQMSQIGLEICLESGESAWIYLKETSTASINYFLDVPLQATIGCSFVALLIVYRRTTLTFIAWLILRLVQYLQSRLLTAIGAILSTCRRRGNTNRSRLTYHTNSRPSAAAVAPSSSSKEENFCVICRDEEKNVVLMPCRHLCVCLHCCQSVHRCPLCRKPIGSILNVYT